jgi:hypothetical protein
LRDVFEFVFLPLHFDWKATFSQLYHKVSRMTAGKSSNSSRPSHGAGGDSSTPHKSMFSKSPSSSKKPKGKKHDIIMFILKDSGKEVGIAMYGAYPVRLLLRKSQTETTDIGGFTVNPFNRNIFFQPEGTFPDASSKLNRSWFLTESSTVMLDPETESLGRWGDIAEIYKTAFTEGVGGIFNEYNFEVTIQQHAINSDEAAIILKGAEDCESFVPNRNQSSSSSTKRVLSLD